MKRSFLLMLVFSAMMATSCSSDTEIKEDQVPGEVITSFKAKYPAAIISKWITENKNGKNL